MKKIIKEIYLHNGGNESGVVLRLLNDGPKNKTKKKTK